MLYKNRKLFSALILLPSATLANGSLDSSAPPNDTGNATLTIAQNNNNTPSSDKAGGKKCWEQETGTMPDQGAVVYMPTTTDQPVAAGYHNGSGVVKGDPNLVPENIRQGVTIFGVVGTATFTATTSPEPRPSQKPQASPEPQTSQEPQTSPEPSSVSTGYTDNDNGTVTDNSTGLVWLKNASCFGRQKWKTATNSVANLADGKCGLSDESTPGSWCLPTLDEWKAMVETQYRNPALSNAAGTDKWTEGDAFLGVVSSWYWSSTVFTDSTSSAWIVSLYDGYVRNDNKGYSNYVWPVLCWKQSVDELD